MPPKRKAQEDGKEPPKKSKRTSTPDHVAEYSVVHCDCPQQSGALTCLTRATTSRDTLRAAQSLFERPWSELNVQESVFRFPHIRTPVFRAKGKDLAHGGKRELSKALCDLYIVIKDNILEPQKDDLYTLENLDEALMGEAGNAVLVSGSSADPVLVLTTGYQVEVRRTIRHEGEEAETAQLVILRHSPHADSETDPAASEYGYFIQLPRGMRVTVNGYTYVNEFSRHGDGPDGGLGTKIIMGPLIRFTIIELLTQRFFFFRTREDLDFKDPKSIETESRSKPSATERQNRSSHGDLPAENVEFTLEPYDAPVDRSREPILGQGSIDDDETGYSEDWTDG
ncbi:hypothetical protein T440DRAFT_544131 [Plenodomus tracheiphilus IPT5]|uniref:Uncharacterized protein n=1 Tax=Plenodomus tracheiphilus IPT5 TaxID=1408161 RepID=A0A6A7AQD0_9PLEO|nr:hypothetical protein T440DRAFT_544131 [Plenodomus tracheiphilus IPT5]